MKWYKHISDSLDDPFIFDLMTEFGAEGYLVFFGTLEIYAREFSAEDGWYLRVPKSYFKQKFQKRQDTVIIKCLEYIATHGKLDTNSCETRIKLPTNSEQTPDKLPTNSEKVFINSGKWDVIIEDNYVIVFIPKFRDLMDEWSLRKLGSNSGVTPKILSTDKEEDKDIKKEKKERIFLPPSIEEISTYCKDRNNGINPNYFYDFYAAKNWMIGKNKMKDWKAAVRTWETRDRETTPQAVTSW